MGSALGRALHGLALGPLFALVVTGASCKHDVPLTDHARQAVYGVAASLPDQWISEDGRNTVVPADSWRLHPRGREDVGVWLLLAWLPRGGRHSSAFPGGREVDERTTAVRVGGASRDGTLSSNGLVWKTDFDAGEVAVSVTAAAHDASDWPALHAVLDALRFDEGARPPVVSDARRALDLARRWAIDNGKPTTGIVYTGPIAGTTQLGFTVFAPRGLSVLRVDPNAGRVELASP